MGTRGSLSGRAVWPWGTCFIWNARFRWGFCKECQEDEGPRHHCVSDWSLPVTERTARGLTFPPGPRSRLFCIGNMNRKLKSRVRTNYHSILCGSFQGRSLMLSLARTTGKVNATDGCSSSCLSHSLWSVGAASRMLPKSPAPVLLPPYISRGVKETNWR